MIALSLLRREDLSPARLSISRTVPDACKLECGMDRSLEVVLRRGRSIDSGARVGCDRSFGWAARASRHVEVQSVQSDRRSQRSWVSVCMYRVCVYRVCLSVFL